MTRNKRLNPDGLSDEEFDRAYGLARWLVRRDGVNEFLINCEQWAKSRRLTRKMLIAVERHAAQPAKSWKNRGGRFIFRPSRRPITLARPAPEKAAA